eukprot:2560999-Pyramimonas_sp.AAC.1
MCRAVPRFQNASRAPCPEQGSRAVPCPAWVVRCRVPCRAVCRAPAVHEQKGAVPCRAVPVRRAEPRLGGWVAGVRRRGRAAPCPRA